jgi:CAP-Gly domain-containing linker protein 1
MSAIFMTCLEQNLDSLAASSSAGNTPPKPTDSMSRATSERSRLAQEIAVLKQSLEESHTSQRVLANERLELLQALDERSAELDALKKRVNREMPVNSGLQEPVRNSRSSSPQSPSSKYDLAAARDEITGLKFVASRTFMRFTSLTKTLSQAHCSDTAARKPIFCAAK